MPVKLRQVVVRCGGRVTVRGLVKLDTRHLSDLHRRGVRRDSREEGVNHTVRLSLTTLAGKATVHKAGVEKHFPYSRVAPEVRLLGGLGQDLEMEVIVRSLELPGHRHGEVVTQTHQILSHLLESLVEGRLVVLTLSLAEGDEAVSVADENQHSSVIDSVQRGNFGDTV